MSPRPANAIRRPSASSQDGRRPLRVATRWMLLTAASAFALIAPADVLLSPARPSTIRPAVTSLAVLLPGSERPFWQAIASQFEQDHPGVQVDLVEGPQSTDLREN